MVGGVKEKVVVVPFVVVVDGRETLPYRFEGLQSGARDGHARLDVRWQWGSLKSGDYSILGHEDRVAVERKSVSDLFSTLGHGRERFEREHERLAALDFAAVVVEGTWERILSSPPERSALNVRSVIGTAIAWSQRYGVHWWAVDGRRAAEVLTFRMLERWWRDNSQRIGVSDGANLDSERRRLLGDGA